MAAKIVVVMVYVVVEVFGANDDETQFGLEGWIAPSAS